MKRKTSRSVCPTDVNPKELGRGISVELEHTRSPKLARKIACDHLWEDRNYYTKLARAGMTHKKRAELLGKASVVKRGLRGVKKKSEKLIKEETVPERDRAVLGDDLDDAAIRAIDAGAEGPLEYIGAGAEGVVFCDETSTAFKVGRKGRGSLKAEADFLKKAGQIPAIKRSVAAFARFDAKNNVLVRECVRQSGEKSGRPRRVSDSEAFDMADRIQSVMKPYGFTAPERKGDSYIYVRGRGPVLVDGGFALPRGQELVKQALDVINKKTPGSLEDMRFALTIEEDVTVPSKIVHKLIKKIDAKQQA